MLNVDHKAPIGAALMHQTAAVDGPFHPTTNIVLGPAPKCT